MQTISAGTVDTPRNVRQTVRSDHKFDFFCLFNEHCRLSYGCSLIFPEMQIDPAERSGDREPLEGAELALFSGRQVCTEETKHSGLLHIWAEFQFCLVLLCDARTLHYLSEPQPPHRCDEDTNNTCLTVFVSIK